jgi:hypothetical protein
MGAGRLRFDEPLFGQGPRRAGSSIMLESILTGTAGRDRRQLLPAVQHDGISRGPVLGDLQPAPRRDLFGRHAADRRRRAVQLRTFRDQGPPRFPHRGNADRSRPRCWTPTGQVHLQRPACRPRPARNWWAAADLFQGALRGQQAAIWRNPADALPWLGRLCPGKIEARPAVTYKRNPDYWGATCRSTWARTISTASASNISPTTTPPSRRSRRASTPSAPKARPSTGRKLRFPAVTEGTVKQGRADPLRQQGQRPGLHLQPAAPQWQDPKVRAGDRADVQLRMVEPDAVLRAV